MAGSALLRQSRLDDPQAVEVAMVEWKAPGRAAAQAPTAGLAALPVVGWAAPARRPAPRGDLVVPALAVVLNLRRWQGCFRDRAQGQEVSLSQRVAVQAEMRLGSGSGS
jgi:hypothetical protein